MKINILAATVMVAFVSSCASRAVDIEASYVSSTLYQNLTCQQLALEAQSVSSRAIAASGRQDNKAGADAAAVAVGMVLFWPALFLTSGDGASAAEVSRLKGEMQAIQDASTRKGCGIRFETEPKKVAPKSAHRQK